MCKLSTKCAKVSHIVDAMINGDVALVVNTVEGAREVEESKDIRSTALAQRIPYFTTMPGASAAAGDSGAAGADPCDPVCKTIWHKVRDAFLNANAGKKVSFFLERSQQLPPDRSTARCQLNVCR